MDSDTRFVTYEVRSPRTPVSLERRRLVEHAGLDLTLRIREEWKLVSHFELRLDQELGQVCHRDGGACLRETDVDDRRDYQLLVRKTRLDFPSGWIELQAPNGSRLRAGRLLVFDATGFARLDGLRATSDLRSWLDVAVYGGKQARATSFASGPGFETQGALRMDLPDEIARERASYVAPPSTTWIAGGHIGLGVERIVKARLVFRETHDGDGVVARRVGVSLRSRPHRLLAMAADAIWDPTDGTLVDARASVSVRASEVVARLRALRHVPRFDLGSIWALFDVVPIDRAELSVAWHRRHIELGGALRGRRAVLSAETERDVGGEAWLSVRHAAWRATLRGWLWAGDLAPAAALLADLRRVFTRAELYGRASVWHFDHPYQSELYGAATSVAVGAIARLTALTRLRFELEWSHSRIVGHRFRGTAGLTIRAWR